jgi:hypothetical protein
LVTLAVTACLIGILAGGLQDIAVKKKYPSNRMVMTSTVSVGNGNYASVMVDRETGIKYLVNSSGGVIKLEETNHIYENK